MPRAKSIERQYKDKCAEAQRELELAVIYFEDGALMTAADKAAQASTLLREAGLLKKQAFGL